MCANTKKITTDILVVGHGIAGLAAVHAVKDENPHLQVVAVDKSCVGYGGKANKGGGHVAFIPPGKEEAYVEYHVRHNGDYLNDQVALRNYATHTVATLDKWERWGGRFVGREQAFNAHPSIPWKICLVDANVLLPMAAKARRRGVLFYEKIQITDLLTHQGQVVGAVGFSLLDGTFYEFHAKAVILACGNQNWGIMKMWASGTGEGIAAAYRAGARMRNAEFGSFINIVSLDHGHVSYEAENHMYNARGQKVNPQRPEGPLGNLPANVCGGVDIGGAIGMAMYAQIQQGNGPLYENKEENTFPSTAFEQIIFPMKADKVPPDWRRPATERFAQLLYQSKQEGYRQSGPGKMKEIQPGVVGECSPLFADHQMASSLAGLYSCGDISANGSSWAGAVPTPPGRNRGSGLMNAVYTASVAGPQAARFAKKNSLLPPDTGQVARLKSAAYAPLHRQSGTTVPNIRWQIKELMQWIPNSSYKSEERLLAAIEQVEQLKKQVGEIMAEDWHTLANAHGCIAMVICGEMFYRGSLLRRESRGWHIREDYPLRDDENMLCWIDFHQGEDGSMTASTTPVPMEDYAYQPPPQGEI